MEKRKENRHKTHGTAPRELFTYILIWDFGFVCVSCVCVRVYVSFTFLRLAVWFIYFVLLLLLLFPLSLAHLWFI